MLHKDKKPVVTYVYRCKLGTMPYANVLSFKPLVAGTRVWVPETTSFKKVRLRYKPPMTMTRRWMQWASCVIDKVDGDVVFLTRM